MKKQTVRNNLHTAIVGFAHFSHLKEEWVLFMLWCNWTTFVQLNGIWIPFINGNYYMRTFQVASCGDMAERLTRGIEIQVEISGTQRCA